MNSLEEFKKSIINCSSTVNQNIQIDEKIRSYALDKTSAETIENRIQDKVKINIYFQEFVAEAVSLSVVDTESNKTKMIEMSFANN